MQAAAASSESTCGAQHSSHQFAEPSCQAAKLHQFSSSCTQHLRCGGQLAAQARDLGQRCLHKIGHLRFVWRGSRVVMGGCCGAGRARADCSQTAHSLCSRVTVQLHTLHAANPSCPTHRQQAQRVAGGRGVKHDAREAGILLTLDKLQHLRWGVRESGVMSDAHRMHACDVSWVAVCAPGPPCTTQGIKFSSPWRWPPPRQNRAAASPAARLQGRIELHRSNQVCAAAWQAGDKEWELLLSRRMHLPASARDSAVGPAQHISTTHH